MKQNHSSSAYHIALSEIENLIGAQIDDMISASHHDMTRHTDTRSAFPHSEKLAA